MKELRSSEKIKPILKELLQDKLEELNGLRPINPVLLQKLKERFQIEMTYNSNGIEGNTLTLNETYWVFQEGVTVKGKSLKEHLEVKDHKKALEKLYHIIESSTDFLLTQQLIKDLHHSVIETSEDYDDYEYRNTDVFIAGSDHKPPTPQKIKMEMKEFIKWTRDKQHQYHLIEFAALLHHRFAQIHPFLDGNGRTARLIMNLFLMKRGFPLVIILKNDRQKYYRVLRQADNGRPKALIQFIAQSSLRSLNLYLDAVRPAQEKDKFISLADATKYCNYSQEYLSKLAKEGRLDAHKKTRSWVTTKQAVMDYIAKHGRRD